MILKTPLEKRNLGNVKEAYVQMLIGLAKRNRDIVVLDADLARCAGTKPFIKAFPTRHFQMAVSEQNTVGVAAGLALAGKIPFASSFANFLSKRACDQASVSVAVNQTNVKLCGTYGGITTAYNGATHCAVEDIAIFRSMPNMVVIVPADTIELREAIKVITKYKGPVYLRMVRGPMPQIFSPNYQFKIGKSVELVKGKDVTIISYGVMTYYCLLAAEQLRKKGIKVRVINMSTIKPLDKSAVIKAAKETKGIVTVENHSIYGGLGSAVAEIVAGLGLKTKVKIMGLADKFGETASLDWQLNYFGLSPAHIVRAVEKVRG